jgi:glycosyltransferase involved in cell wall biosynthesis
MERLPLRRLVAGPAPAPDRIFHHNVWFRGHNNPRYAELLPRLRRLDGYLLTLPESPLLRGAAYRLLRAVRPLRDRAVFTAAGRRYRTMFTTDVAQIACFPGPVVADVDDPTFSDEEVRLLGLPNLVAYVVTAERAARRLGELGLDKPVHIVPQGVSFASLSEGRAREVAGRFRREGDLVVGYMAAWLLSTGDRGSEKPLHNVDHLLDLWDEIHRKLPDARLWLLGGASPRVRRRVEGRADVVLFGRVPRSELLSYVTNFDVALYPRAKDEGIRAAKIGEYLGAGVPTVSYDYEVTADLKDAGAGVLVASPREFVDAVVRLATDQQERRRLARAAEAAGRLRDWDALARDYAEILDLHLPPDALATLGG